MKWAIATAVALPSGFYRVSDRYRDTRYFRSEWRAVKAAARDQRLARIMEPNGTGTGQITFEGFPQCGL